MYFVIQADDQVEVTEGRRQTDRRVKDWIEPGGLDPAVTPVDKAYLEELLQYQMDLERLMHWVIKWYLDQDIPQVPLSEGKRGQADTLQAALRAVVGYSETERILTRLSENAGEI